MSRPVWTSAEPPCPDCGCDPDDPEYCPACGNEYCPCGEEFDVIPLWCPLPQGDQALRDIGY
jgi:hypothetical protein